MRARRTGRSAILSRAPIRANVMLWRFVAMKMRTRGGQNRFADSNRRPASLHRRLKDYYSPVASDVACFSLALFKAVSILQYRRSNAFVRALYVRFTLLSFVNNPEQNVAVTI